MQHLSKYLIIGGLILMVIGLILSLSPKISFFGKLSGDVYINKGNFVFYFPIVTSIVVSIILTIILNFIFRK